MHYLNLSSNYRDYQNRQSNKLKEAGIEKQIDTSSKLISLAVKFNVNFCILFSIECQAKH